jgi:1-phosphofructokinase
VDELIETVVAASSSDGWVAASGSLAPGMPVDLYARLGRGLAGKGAKLAVDTSGRALRAAVSGGPGLLKPNRHELSELVDQPLVTLGEVTAAAQELNRAGVAQVLVSLGPDGAVLVDETAVLHGEVSVDRVSNTVGAGDALLAGFLAGGGSGAGALANALAWARAAVRSRQTSMAPPGETDHEAVRINVELDPDRVLEDDEASISPDSESSTGDGAVPSGQALRSPENQ